jgi:replicative DNA helicase
MLNQAREAEAAILGAVLLRNELLAEVEGELDADDLDTPAHRAVWGAMLSVARQGHPIDVVTLEQELRTHDRLAQAGGLVGLTSLADRYRDVRNVMAHVELVREAARRRRLHELAGEIRDAARQSDEEVEAIVEGAIGQLGRLLAGKHQRRSVADATGLAIDHARARMRGEKGAQPVTTGIATLDAAIRGGLEPGRLYIVAARPGNGKTALAVCMQTAAARSDVPTYGKHLEMTELDLGQRLLGANALVNLEHVEHPTKTQHMDKMLAAAEELDVLRIEFDYERTTAKQTRSEIRSWRRANPDGIGVVVVDYLQLHLPESKRSERRDLDIGEWTAAYKALAKELGIAIVLCCQLNRKVEEREDKRPRVSDLRESGSIEQDADAILLLYRPAHYFPGKDIHECDVIVGKQRQGPTGTVRVRFEPYYTRFLDEPEHKQDETDATDEPWPDDAEKKPRGGKRKYEPRK